MIRNKKGVSAMVAYVLLIVIAVGLSVGVYNFVKVYIPKEKPECPSDIHLIVQSYDCSKRNTLTVELANRGLFRADAVYIRVGRPDVKVRLLINDLKNLGQDTAKFYIRLNPGETVTNSYVAGPISEEGDYVLEVQPAVFTEQDILAACTGAVITQNIVCDFNTTS